MAQQNIDFGTFPDDPSADAIRTAFQKVQQNFTEVYSGLTSTAVRSVNRTAGPGITVNSPTGNVVVTANIASVSISSVTLKVGTSPNPVTNNATYTSYSQTLYIEIPDNLSVANISASGNITANGNLIVSNANLGNAATANYFIGDGTNLTNVTSATSNTANTAGTVTQNAQPNITSVGTLTSVSVSGNLTSGNANLGNAVTGNFFIGSGANLTSLAGANVTGEVANANYASYANVAYSVSAGNISGTVNLANFATTANAVAGANVSGEVLFAATANAVAGANVSGEVANATYANSTNTANSATTAGTVTTADQPNITSTGTLASLSVSGNANIGNIGTAGVITASGTITSGNLATAGTLSVGGNTTLGNLSVSGNLIAGNIQVDSIVNGTSNVDITNTNGNVTIGVDGTPNVLTVTSTGANIAGTLSASGNINAGNVTATTFTGALSGAATSATTAGTVTTNAQPNITSTGTLSSLTVSGNSNLGDVGNVSITGSAGFLQSDGNGNLSFASVISQTIPGAANSLLLSNGASNNIIASGNIKFNDPQLDITGNLSVTGNANVGNIGATNIVGTLTTNAQPNITSIGTLTSLALGGNLNSNSNIVLNNVNANISTLGNMNANVYFGNGSQLTGVTAATAGTVTTNAQPNITSVGVLSSLEVSGSITPTTNITYDLGNATHAFRDLYLSGSSIKLGNSTITSNASGVIITNPGGNVVPLKPGGSNTQVQYNDDGTFSGHAGMVFNESTTTFTANNLIATSTANLGNVANVTITGGTANFVLTTDGNGILSWSNVSNVVGNVVAAGANTQVQYNDDGILGGHPGMTFDEYTSTLTANNFVATSTANLGNVANVHITGGSNGQAIITDGNGNLSWGNAGGGGDVAGTNTQVQFNDGGVMGANANLTFDKTSGNLTVGSNVVAVNFIGSGANTPTIISGTNLDLTANAAVRVPSNLTLTGSNVSLGNVSNLHITGGSNGQALITDGSGNLSWADAGTGGGTNLIVEDEGNVLTNTANTLNFTGNGVVATSVGNVVTVDITHNGPAGNLYEVQVNDGNGGFYADYGLSYDAPNNNVFANATVYINRGTNSGISDLNIGEVQYDPGSNTYAYKENARLRYIDDQGSSFYGFTAQSEDFLFITMEPGTESFGVTALVMSNQPQAANTSGANNTIFGISVNTDVDSNNSTGTEPNYVPLFNLSGRDLYIPQLSEANANNILGFDSTTGRITYTVPTVIVQDEGSNVLTLANTINFVGNGVIASNVGGVATITISGGSSNGTVAGSNTQVQFNDAGSFGAVSSFTYNKSTNTLSTINFIATTSADLGNVGNITITGGNNGFFLQTDGAGNLTWAAGGNSTGNGIPGGANTQIQYNDGGIFGGTTGFTFNKTTTVFTANNIVATSTANLGNVGNVTITGGDSGQVLTTDGTGNLVWANAVPNQAGGYYLHTQASASNVWTVTHNLNRQYVVIEPIDSNGNSYTGRYDFPTIQFINANALTMTWSSSLTGYAAVVGGTGNTSGISGVAVQDEGANVLASANTINFVGNGVIASNVGGVATITIQGIGSNNTVAGSDTQVQFNDGNIFGASAGLTYDKSNTKLTSNNFVATTTANLGNVGNVTITGGGANFILKTDGSGNLSWANVANGGIGAISAAGTNTQVQYNDNGILGGNPGFIFNEGTTLVTANNLTVSSISRFGNVGNVHIDGGSSNFILKTDGTGNLSWANVANGDIGNLKAAGSNTQIQFNDDGTFGAIAGFTFDKSSTIFTANNIVATSTANLGDVGNIYVGGGNALDVLVTIDGAGNLAWGTIITDGAGGANTQVQYNDDGVLGGNPSFTFDESITRVTVNNFVATSTANLGNVGNVTITGGSANYVLKTDGAGNLSWTAQSGGGSGNITIQDEGTNVIASANVINFVGPGVVASNVGGVATITIDNSSNSYYGGYYLHTQGSASNVWTVTHNLNRQYVTVEPIDSTGNSYTGRYDFPIINYVNANALTMTWSSALDGYAAIVGGGTTVEGFTVQDEGSNVITTANTINFVGAGVEASNVGGVATVTINGGIVVYDEGVPFVASINGLNFTGSGVTTTVTPGSGIATVTIPGVSGGASVSAPFIRVYTGNATIRCTNNEYWWPIPLDNSSIVNTIGAVDYSNGTTYLPAGTYFFESTVYLNCTGSDTIQGAYVCLIANPSISLDPILGTNFPDPAPAGTVLAKAGVTRVGDYSTTPIMGIGSFTISVDTYVSLAFSQYDGNPQAWSFGDEFSLGYNTTILKLWKTA